MGTGQFCTNPGLMVLLAGPDTDAFIAKVRDKFAAAPVGTLLGKSVEDKLDHAVKVLTKAGAEVLTGGTRGGGRGYCFANTVLKVDGAALPARSGGHAGRGLRQRQPVRRGQTTWPRPRRCCPRSKAISPASIYSDTAGSDDAVYPQVAPILRRKVGRLLNDKMPTGVAVSPAMNHGGPYPATGHPGFTAVGHPGVAAPFCGPALLRRRSRAAPAGPAAQPEPQRHASGATSTGPSRRPICRSAAITCSSNPSAAGEPPL